jgi:hypothetical protein
MDRKVSLQLPATGLVLPDGLPLLHQVNATPETKASILVPPGHPVAAPDSKAGAGGLTPIEEKIGLLGRLRQLSVEQLDALSVGIGNPPQHLSARPGRAALDLLMSADKQKKTGELQALLADPPALPELVAPAAIATSSTPQLASRGLCGWSRDELRGLYDLALQRGLALGAGLGKIMNDPDQPRSALSREMVLAAGRSGSLRRLLELHNELVEKGEAPRRSIPAPEADTWIGHDPSYSSLDQAIRGASADRIAELLFVLGHDHENLSPRDSGAAALGYLQRNSLIGQAGFALLVFER